MKEWAQLIVSWPVVALIAIIFFRRPLRDLLSRFSTSDGGKAELGPIKLELGKLTVQGKDAVERTRAATELMAESRLLELEITSNLFSATFTPEQRAKMQDHIARLRSLKRD